MHDNIARLLRLSSDEESFKYFCRLIITTTQQGYGWWEGKVHEHRMLYIRRKGFQVCLHCNLATCKLPNCFTLMHIGASQFGSHHCIHLMQKFHACLLPLISVEVPLRSEVEFCMCACKYFKSPRSVWTLSVLLLLPVEQCAIWLRSEWLCLNVSVATFQLITLIVPRCGFDEILVGVAGG